MPIINTPRFASNQLMTLPIESPGYGGLNIKDLEYELDTTQSPKMLNMMYRNGSFSKRYGQELEEEFSDTVYAMAFYDDDMIVHSGTKIYKNGTELYTGVAAQKGIFINFNKKLYYICGEYYQYNGTTFTIVEPYIPEIVVNRSPDGSTPGDQSDKLNLIGAKLTEVFDSDGTSTEYHLMTTNLDQVTPVVTVDDEQWTYDETLSANKTFKINYTTGVVTFNPAPDKVDGINNVTITVSKSRPASKALIINSKYYACFGGANNSCLFVAGSGNALLYYTSPGDATYFPDNNYMGIGNGEQDIKGFGLQYNVLLVFKDKETYSLDYYLQSSSTTSVEADYGLIAFSSQMVNSNVGCDCPDTIKLVNNQLTWLSSIHGVCTLVSTEIIDERNIRPISRNINRSSDGVGGLLDWDNLDEVSAADFDNKYFLTNPTTGETFMWDYGNAPYSNTGKIESDARRLAWYKFDNIYAEKYCLNKDMYYIKGKKIIKLNNSFDDFGTSINAYYQTPLFNFYKTASNKTYSAIEYLKNVPQMYVQVRGDTASRIKIKYITDENPNGEDENDDILVYRTIWNDFEWERFGWTLIKFGNTFYRKCGLKKVQLAGVYFYNNEVGRDMSISSLSLKYQFVKTVK